MSFALVVVATITLVVGLLQSGLTLIYASIACSVVAGLVLAIAVLRGRPEEAPVERAAPAQPAASPPPWEREERPAAAPAEAAPWSAPATPREEAPTEPAAPAPGSPLWRVRESQTEQITVSTVETEGLEADEGDGDADGFPIPDYERLRASEILRRLPDLDPDQLEQVRARELAGMNRFTVLSKIDAELAASATRTGWEIDDDEWGGPARSEDEEDEGVAAADEGAADAGAGDEEAEPEAAPQAPPARRLAARPAARKATTEKAAPAARKAPARKATTKKATTKKATGKKAQAKKAPAARKAPAKKAPAAEKAPAAKKAPAKKAPAKKAPAKKTTARTTTAKKATGAKKTTPRRGPGSGSTGR